MGSLSIPNDHEKRPHALLVPAPAQGHVNPMMKIARLLLHRGFHVTFVNTEFNHTRMLQSQGSAALQGFQNFRFATIPDGLPADDEMQDPRAVISAIRSNLLDPFRELVFKLNDTTSSSSEVPPITCIVSDGCMTFTLNVAQELDIPNALLWTCSACGIMACAHLRQLMEKGFTPFKDSSFLTSGYLDTVIDWIPGMKGIQLKYLPSLIRTTDPNDAVLKFNRDVVERSIKGTTIIVNTFEALENGVLHELKSMFPNISTIGPLHLLVNQILDHDEESSLSCNLWEEDNSCLEWLDSKESNSVLYVNFGSNTRMTKQQLIEFAWGLAKSNQNFLWIIRSDLVTDHGTVTNILPPQFENEIKGRGVLVNWCNQERVRNHRAVGGFLTHCGWNSILESICAGVPMICWPAFFEQSTNCWFCCNHWGIGIELDSRVKMDNVERLTRELIAGEKGKNMREKALEWKKLAQDASSISTGSSYKNFEHMVNNVLLKKI